VRLRGEDGRFYDIAIDDVFAAGYIASSGNTGYPASRRTSRRRVAADYRKIVQCTISS
jgi:hypothetical protein